MADRQGILQPREPFLDGKGPVEKQGPSRSWWRFLNSLDTMAGQLAQPVVIPPNNILVSGDITSGSTVEIVSLPPGTILGNSSNIVAQPVPVPIGGGLKIDGSGLAAADLAAMSLAGNPNAVVGPPQTIIIGENLILVSGTLSSPGPGVAGANFAQVMAIASWGP